MTLTNRELFYRDPTETKIPNDGVAKVVRPETEQQWDVLEWELQSFVCDGEYDARPRAHPRQLPDQPQPGAAACRLGQRVLRQRQVAPASGCSSTSGATLSCPAARARGAWLTLPDEIRDHLTSCPTAGSAAGGLWSAAGTLASGKSDAVRLAFLSVLFESAGLPEQYPLARFMIWARENGYLEPVEAAVERRRQVARQGDPRPLRVADDREGAARGGSEPGRLGARTCASCSTTQFPPTTKDITDDEMFDVMDDVLRLQSTTDEKLPLTLVVLDEMQQYIGDDNEKALAVQHIVEGCSARFDSQVLFVATGQSALDGERRRCRSSPTASRCRSRCPTRTSRQSFARWSCERSRSTSPRSQATPRCGERRDRPAARRHSARREGCGQARPRSRLPTAADAPALLGAGPTGDRPGRQGRRAANPAQDRPRSSA